MYMGRGLSRAQELAAHARHHGLGTVLCPDTFRYAGRDYLARLVQVHCNALFTPFSRPFHALFTPFVNSFFTPLERDSNAILTPIHAPSVQVQSPISSGGTSGTAAVGRLYELLGPLQEAESSAIRACQLYGDSLETIAAGDFPVPPPPFTSSACWYHIRLTVAISFQPFSWNPM
jgi:hypothetical protein